MDVTNTPPPVGPDSPEPSLSGQFSPEQLQRRARELRRLLLLYEFALESLNTNINILRDEFRLLHDYNPIEHVTSRVKEPQSILDKALRKGTPLTPEGIQREILDVAGVRITCSFPSDIYRVREHLLTRGGLRLVQEKDYVANPKPNGYQSLHLIVQVPVDLSDAREWVPVEIQLRTIAMDFWASLEHKIYYKYRGDVPDRMIERLKEAAETSAALDAEMERLHQEIQDLPHEGGADPNDPLLPLIDAIRRGAAGQPPPTLPPQDRE